jgi:hypothetical protein
MFHAFEAKSGGINTFFHIENPVPLDEQILSRMDRLMLYSGAVVDTQNGASVVFPEIPDFDRYVSLQVVDNDHYCPEVVRESGEHPIQADTRYVALIVRIQLFNPLDAAELRWARSLQTQFRIRASAAQPLPPLRWALPSLDALRDRYEAAFQQTGFHARWQGPRNACDEGSRHLAAAAAWGLLPQHEAAHFASGAAQRGGVRLRGDAAYVATFAVPEHEACWSLAVYGPDGRAHHANSTVSSSTVAYDPDGAFTVHFGPPELCGDARNRLDTPDDWSLLLRVYRPSRAALAGYRLPPLLTRAEADAHKPRRAANDEKEEQDVGAADA